jgi:hypothetical protein
MIVIEHTDGTTQQGILLSLQGDTLRIAAKGSDDILEFRLVSGSWVSEDCEVATFAFPLAIFEAIGITPENQPDIKNEPVAAPVPEWHLTAAAGLLN